MLKQLEDQDCQDWHAFTARRLVATEFRVAESDLIKPSRATADIAFARQVAMYLAHVIYSLSYGEVATAFQRERSTVAHACAVVEDARDDPEFEARVSKLEDRLQQLDDIRRLGQVKRRGRLAELLSEEVDNSPSV